MANRYCNLTSLLEQTATAPEASRHKNDVTTIVFHDNKLISGADDGKIKIWTPDLNLIAEFQAHPVNVYSLAVLGNTLYSCSNDGTLKAWEMNTWKPKATLIDNPQVEVIKVYTNNGRLYAGNEEGEVSVYENDKHLATYCLHEDFQDFVVIGNLVYNARNIDVSITEMMPAPRFGYMSRACMIGRFPVQHVGDKVCFLSRCTKNIYVHAAGKEERFKRIAEIKAHAMTITTMCSFPEKKNFLCSGGYDRVLKIWDLSTMKQVTSIDLDVCINDITPGEAGTIYYASSEGYIGLLHSKGKI